MDKRLEKIRRFEANVMDFESYINDRIKQTKAENRSKDINETRVPMNVYDAAAEKYEDILETDGYEYLDGLIEQISKIFNYTNLGEFTDDMHDAITNAVCSMTDKYSLK